MINLSDPLVTFLLGIAASNGLSLLALAAWLYLTDLSLDVEEVANFAP
jgi:hypothetical protein